jgi:hypothetical protein
LEESFTVFWNIVSGLERAKKKKRIRMTKRRKKPQLLEL